MSEGDFVVAVFYGVFYEFGAALGGAPVTVHFFAGFESADDGDEEIGEGYAPFAESLREEAFFAAGAEVA